MYFLHTIWDNVNQVVRGQKEKIKLSKQYKNKFENVIDLRNAFAFKFGIAYAPEDEGGDNQDDENLDDDNENEGGGDNKDNKDNKESDSKKSDDDKKKNYQLQQEAKRYRLELREAQNKLKEIEDKDKSEVERLSEQVSEIPKILSVNDELRLENAFLKACQNIDVNDVELVQLLVSRRPEVKIEDNEVVGMEEALEEIKKSKPLLFGSAEKEDDKNGNKENAGSGTNGASGSVTNRKKQSGPDMDELRKRYPALRK